MLPAAAEEAVALAAEEVVAAEAVVAEDAVAETREKAIASETAHQVKAVVPVSVPVLAETSWQ